MHHNSHDSGVDVAIEGGTRNEQYLIGAVISKALTECGFTQAVHVIDDGRVVDAAAQRLVYPSLFEVIREGRPDFLNMPVIVSAYHRAPVDKERRAYDRVQERALAVATSYSDNEEELNREWNSLSAEEKELLLDA